LNSYAWFSGVLLDKAIVAGGLGSSDTPTAAEIVKGLTSMKSETLDGTAPPLTFPAGQPHPINCWFTSETVNHVANVANNKQITCQSSSS
jgi:branched-chain amino acid transport system substrate-binding protein